MNSRQITDPKGSMNNCPPLSEEIIEEAAELLSFWAVIRNDPRLAPHTAADLLGVWAHLQRFATGDVAGEIADRLDGLVHEEKDRLATCFLRLSHPALDEAIIRIDRAWDGLGTWDACQELESETRDLFDALDRQSLAVYALQQLVSAEDGWRPDIEELARKVEKAERTLLQHAESFYPAASLATAMLEEYRMDLAEVNRALWMTTLKYRRMADLYEEEEVPADLDAEQRHRIAVTLPGAGENMSREEREPHFAMAAQSGLPTAVPPNQDREGATVSVYTLRDQQGRVVDIRTDRDGRVFVVLPDDISLAAPKSVLINNQVYLLKPSQPLLIEIVDLRKGDLRELADSDFIVKGTWQ